MPRVILNCPVHLGVISHCLHVLLEVRGEIVGNARYVLFGMCLWKSVIACYPKWFCRTASESQYLLFSVYAMFYTLHTSSEDLLGFCFISERVCTWRLLLSYYIHQYIHWLVIYSNTGTLTHSCYYSIS